jgi:N-acyl homoserine lactone hydrolase
VTQVRKLWPLLTATHRYDKSLSTFNRGAGQMIDAPILAYLIETANGRILYDVGCDYAKINNPLLKAKYYNPDVFQFGAPEMTEEQRIPNHLARLGLTAADVDLIFIGHLHFDHAGGLKELRRCGCGADIHIQQDELAIAKSGQDEIVFDDDLLDDLGTPLQFKMRQGEYCLVPGVEAIATPGHTVAHMSLLIEMPKGPPILLAGDAADLQENIVDEVAPGSLWQGAEQQAIQSIRKLKKISTETGAWLWPNHDMPFYRSLKEKSNDFCFA